MVIGKWLEEVYKAVLINSTGMQVKCLPPTHFSTSIEILILLPVVHVFAMKSKIVK